MSNVLNDIATSDAFRFALLISAAGFLPAAFSGIFSKTRIGQVGAIVVTVAMVLALMRHFPTPPLFAAAAALLAGGPALGSRLADRAIGAIPGAAVLTYTVATFVPQAARGGTASFGVHPVLIAIVIAGATALIADHDAQLNDAAISLPMLAISAVGVFITVPDTEMALVLVGATIVLAFAGWPVRLSALGPLAGGVMAGFGLVAMTAARPGAVIGAVAALGIFIAEPIGRVLLGDRPSALHRLAAGTPATRLLVLVLHGVIVLGVTRIAGLRESAIQAALIAIPILAIGVFVSALPAGPAEEPGQSHDRTV